MNLDGIFENDEKEVFLVLLFSQIPIKDKRRKCEEKIENFK